MDVVRVRIRSKCTLLGVFHLTIRHCKPFTWKTLMTTVIPIWVHQRAEVLALRAHPITVILTTHLVQHLQVFKLGFS